MSETTNASYLSKIQALLRTAEDAAKRGQEAERDAFQQKADELIAKWGIDVAMLAAAGGGKSEAIIQKHVECGGIYGKQLTHLANWISAALGTTRGFATQIYKPGDRKPTDVFMFVGYESDVERATLLYTSLQLQALTSMQQWWKGQQLTDPHLVAIMTGMEKYIARRSFVQGFASTATDKLRDQQLKTVRETPGTGTDLVLRDRKTNVDAYVDSKYNLHQGRASKIKHNIDGSRAGKNAGRNADTGAGRVGGGRRGIGS